MNILLWVALLASQGVQVEVVLEGLEVPSGLAFLPDGQALLTERPGGRLSRVDVERGTRTSIDGVPAVHGSLDGGLLDVVLHPDYEENGWIYVSYSERVQGGRMPAPRISRCM